MNEQKLIFLVFFVGGLLAWGRIFGVLTGWESMMAWNYYNAVIAAIYVIGYFMWTWNYYDNNTKTTGDRTHE